MKYWFALCVTVEKVLADNSGKFINEKSMIILEVLNNNIHTTGTESIWSNGTVEQTQFSAIKNPQ